MSEKELKRGLNPRHRMMITLYLQGMDMHKIDNHLGVTHGYTSAILQTDIARGEIKKRMQELDIEAHDTMAAMAASQRVIAGAAPSIAAQLVSDALDGDNKPAERTSACKQAFAILAGRAGEDERPVGEGLKIFIQGAGGKVEQAVDIFPDHTDARDGVAKELMGGLHGPNGGADEEGPAADEE